MMVSLFEGFGLSLAVVPIVVNAGAALLPAFIAGIVSVFVVLLRPSQWGRVARQRPWVPVVLVLAVALGAYLWFSPSSAPVREGGRGGVVAQPGSAGVDWTAVALQYLRDQQRRPISAMPGPAGVDPNTRAAAPSQPFVFRADMKRSGAMTATGPANLVEAWRWADPQDPYAMVLSSLATDGRSLYGATASLSPPDTFGAIFCLDAQTGQLKWITGEAVDPQGSAQPFKGFFSSPALTADGKYLLIGEGLHTDSNSALLCLDAETGKVHWRIATTQHLESSPAIDGDTVVIGVGAIERPEDHRVPPGGNPGFVLAVRISDGKELWRHQVNDPESSPAIADGILYIGSGVNGSEVVALRIASDEVLQQSGLPREVWRATTPHPALAAVTVADDLVLIGCGDGDYVRPGKNGSVVALDRETGKVRWQTPRETTPASVLSPVAVRGNVGILGLGDGNIVALDLKQNGQLLWRTPVSEVSAVNAGVAVTDASVYALSADGWLGVFSLTDGKEIGRYYVNDPKRPGELGMSVSAPIVHQNSVYLGSETGGVVALVGGGQ